MPIHTYSCDNCGHEFDQQQKFSDKSLVKCPNCRKHALRKVYKPARIVFKGSGFYATDNRSGSRVASNSNGKSDTKEVKADSEKSVNAEDSKKVKESKSQANESGKKNKDKSDKSE
ncbi:MAG: hypothetical protein FVQ83_00125 [Chloroflexi bacterium]|nr:hypothetical protein [Chloroflexota bacterium]